MLVDHVKVVIKSGKKHTSQEKLRALKLLHKALIKSADNSVFVVYVAKKIMERLQILATHCPKGINYTDESSIPRRGANIFLPDEPDTKNASQFLI